MASTADIATTRQPKETKAQKVERLKRSKNPWEHFDEIKEFARQGRPAVLPEWANLYFKWWGIYTQGDGAGAIGGTGGEGKATQYFMMRIALPNGLLRSNQLRAIAQISERYGHTLADLTVGQKSGYTFALANCTKTTVNNQDMYTSFEATAVPQAVGKTGNRGFCMDMSGEIKSDPSGGTNCTVPIQ